MKLSELRQAIDAAIVIWGDRPITTRAMFFSERGPQEAEILIHEAQIGILSRFLLRGPTDWVTLDAISPRSALRAAQAAATPDSIPAAGTCPPEPPRAALEAGAPDLDPGPSGSP